MQAYMTVAEFQHVLGIDATIARALGDHEPMGLSEREGKRTCSVYLDRARVNGLIWGSPKILLAAARSAERSLTIHQHDANGFGPTYRS
jgi:hypothetical protein